MKTDEQINHVVDLIDEQYATNDYTGLYELYCDFLTGDLDVIDLDDTTVDCSDYPALTVPEFYKVRTQEIIKNYKYKKS